jgi:hypothetical protein
MHSIYGETAPTKKIKTYGRISEESTGLQRTKASETSAEPKSGETTTTVTDQGLWQRTRQLGETRS